MMQKPAAGGEYILKRLLLAEPSFLLALTAAGGFSTTV